MDAHTWTRTHDHFMVAPLSTISPPDAMALSVVNDPFFFTMKNIERCSRNLWIWSTIGLKEGFYRVFSRLLLANFSVVSLPSGSLDRSKMAKNERKPRIGGGETMYL